MKVHEFSQDLGKKAENLERLQGHDFGWPDLRGKRLFFLGMGSSLFAADMIARRLQNAGVNAYASLASLWDLPRLGPDDRVIAISATGQSVETRAVVERLGGEVLFLTNAASSALPAGVIPVSMNSIPETGGVASLTYQATLIALLHLEEQLTGESFLQDALVRARETMQTLDDTSGQWRDRFTEFVNAPDGVHFIAPLERLGSARQSALMLRECPRFRADASEAGDWAHIDVYLTKNYDLRLVLFAGSPWSENVWEWAVERGRRVVTIGHHDPRAEASIEFPHQDDDVVAMLTETTYAEWAAATAWLSQQG